MALLIKVTVLNQDGTLHRQYVMDHDDATQRRTLGEQCRNAFEDGQSILTSPMSAQNLKGH